MFASKALSKKQDKLCQTTKNGLEDAAALGKAFRGMVKVIATNQYVGSIDINSHWHDFNTNTYSQRILDTLARLLYLDSKLICCALSVANNKCYISYNIDITTNYTLQKIICEFFALLRCGSQYYADGYEICKKEFIEYCLTEKFSGKFHPFYYPQEYKDAIFNLDRCLDLIARTFNGYGTVTPQNIKDFVNLSKKIHTTYDDLAQGINDINEFYKLLCEESHSWGLDDQTQLVCTILESAHSRILYFRQRLMQDCTKIIKHFPSSVLSKITENDVEIIPNPLSMHCELNLREFLKQRDFYPTYIGISKLSCLVCDTQIKIDETENHIPALHAGGHGMAYFLDDNGLGSIVEDPQLKVFYKILQIYNQCNHNITEDEDTGYIDAARQYHNFSPFDEQPIVAFMGHNDNV